MRKNVKQKYPFLERKKCKNFYIFKNTGKLKMYELKKSLRFVDLDQLILKMHTVLELEIVFNKIIEENWNKFCVEISYS